jgi:hypothetical protein
MSRSISITTIVRRTFKIYAAQASLLLPVAVCLVGVLRILEAMPVRRVSGLALVVLLAGFVAVMMFTGIVVQVVADTREGQSVASFRGALRTKRRRGRSAGLP